MIPSSPPPASAHPEPAYRQAGLSKGAEKTPLPVAALPADPPFSGRLPEEP